MEFIIAGLLFFVILFVLFNLRRCTVFEHERGLLYKEGKFQRVLAPGRHWYLRLIHSVLKIDVRNQYISIAGQEVLSSDNVSLKVSLAASFKVCDPYMAVNETTNYHQALYLLLQLQLRDLVGSTSIDDLLSRRKEIGEALYNSTVEKAREIGIELLLANIKDIMFPGELKDVFAQVVNARKEGQAALERARGETAALRNLANAAGLLESNPGLLQLRLLQTLSGSSGNTVILTSSLDGVSSLNLLTNKKPKEKDKGTID